MSQPSVSRLHVAGGSHGPLPRPCRPSANSRTFSCWQQAGLQAHKPRQRQLWRHRQGPSCSREPRQELTACSRSQPGSHGNSATCKTWCIDIVSSHVSLGFNRSSSRAHGRTAVHLVRSSRSSSDNTGHTGPGSQPKDAAEFQEASPSSASDVSNSSSSSGSSSSPQGAGGPEAAGASSPPGGTSHDGSGAGGGGSTGGRGPGPGSGDNPAAKMPKWFQVGGIRKVPILQRLYCPRAQQLS
jgi:hypothetical protein